MSEDEHPTAFCISSYSCAAYYVLIPIHPFILLVKSIIAKQKSCHDVNVVSDGSPSRMRMVRRISFGMTTLPRSSMRLTIPVAFIYRALPVINSLFRLIFQLVPIIDTMRQIMQDIHAEILWQYSVRKGACEVNVSFIHCMPHSFDENEIIACSSSSLGEMLSSRFFQRTEYLPIMV